LYPGQTVFLLEQLLEQVPEFLVLVQEMVFWPLAV
jgi:hypothetical protein